MVLRWLGVLLAAVLCTACANAGAEADFGGPSIVAKQPPAVQPAGQQQRASVAASVLASIALERVTGRAPDPITGHQ